MRKSLLLPLLIPLIVFAAVKGYFWYQVKRFVDQAIVQAAPFVDVDYDSIETSFAGHAGIKNIRIYPLGSNDFVKISSIRVLSDDWLYFIKVGTPFDEGDLPNKLGFEINGVVLNLGAEIAEQLVQQSAEVDDSFPGCEKSELQGVELLQKLGYTSLTSDIKMSYLFSPESEYLTVRTEVVTQDSASMEMSSDIDLGISSLEREQLTRLSPKLGGVDITYKDDSFVRRKIAYCAEINGESVQDFTNRHVELTAEQYRQMGFVFSNSLIEGYRQFLTGDGEARLMISADEAIGMQEVMMRSPDEHLKSLNLHLEVDGKVINPVELSWEPPALSFQESLSKQDGVEAVADDANVEMNSSDNALSGTSGLGDNTASAEQNNSNQAEKPQKPKMAYKVTSLNDLNNYLGFKVQIDTHNGHKIEGEIIQVLADRMELRRKVGAGVIEMPVVFDHVLRIKVLR